MPKPGSQSAPVVSVTTRRVVRAKDASGKVIPEKWDCVEETVTGTVTARKVLVEAKRLPIAREVYRRHEAIEALRNPEEAS